MPSPDDAALVPGSGSSEKPASGDHTESALEVRHDAARVSFDSATEDAIAKFIEPFADTFGQLHDVKLTDFAAQDVVQELDNIDAMVLQDANVIVEAFVSGGTPRDIAAQTLRGALSVTAHAGTLSSVVKAMPSLPPVNLAGRAAQVMGNARATLPKYGEPARAFLVRSQRTLARNKRTLVIAGAAAGAGLLFTWALKADKADRERKLAMLRQQQLEDVAAHQAALREDLDHSRLLFATERTEEAAQTLGHLIAVGLSRLPALDECVSGNDDFATYGSADRRVVAEVVALAQTIASVIASTRRTNVAHPEHDDDAHAATLHVAQEVLNRYAADQFPRIPGSNGGVLAATAATLNTSTDRKQIIHLLQERSYIEHLANRCANVHDGVRAGFFFELLHTLGFNLNAIAQDSDFRAEMTERLNRPHDAVDIEIADGNGAVVARAQAKVVDSKYHRIGPRNGIADAKYDGQARLIPSDHVAETQDALDRALARSSDNIYSANYRDAKEHVVDVLSAGGIESDPLTAGQVHQAANDPTGFINEVLSDNRRNQAAIAGLTGGTTAALSAFATDIGTHVLSEGHLDGCEWTRATVAAARTGVAAAFATSASSYLQTGAIQAVENGGTSRLQDSLANGDHGPALTQAAVRIAAIVHGAATDQLTPTDAAIAITETVLQSAAIWACTYGARKVVRDPETAAIVAGVAGQIASQLIRQGFQIAILGRDPNPQWDAAYEALLADTAALERDYAIERDELSALTAQARARFTERVQPALEHLETGQTAPEEAIANLVAIAEHFGGAALFTSLDEFDEFMADPATTLVLHLS